MDHIFYKQQIERLKSQWPHAYSEERMIVLFNAFKNVANFDFRDAVTECIANCKGAPLLKELTEAIERARANYFNNKRIDEATQRDAFLNIPDSGTADREFKNKCVELYNSFMDKKITREQFYQGCDLLDQASKLYNRPKTTIVPPKQFGRPYKEENDDKPY